MGHFLLLQTLEIKPPVIIYVNWENNITSICDRFSHHDCDVTVQPVWCERILPYNVWALMCDNIVCFILYTLLVSMVSASLFTHNSLQQRGHPVLSRWFISRHLIFSSLPPSIYFSPDDSLHSLTVLCLYLHFPLGVIYSRDLILSPPVYHSFRLPSPFRPCKAPIKDQKHAIQGQNNDILMADWL